MMHHDILTLPAGEETTPPDTAELRFVYLSLIAEQLPKQHVRSEQPRRREMTDEELAVYCADPSNHFRGTCLGDWGL